MLYILIIEGSVCVIEGFKGVVGVLEFEWIVMLIAFVLVAVQRMQGISRLAVRRTELLGVLLRLPGAFFFAGEVLIRGRGNVGDVTGGQRASDILVGLALALGVEMFPLGGRVCKPAGSGTLVGYTLIVFALMLCAREAARSGLIVFEDALGFSTNGPGRILIGHLGVPGTRGDSFLSAIEPIVVRGHEFLIVQCSVRIRTPILSNKMSIPAALRSCSTISLGRRDVRHRSFMTSHGVLRSYRVRSLCKVAILGVAAMRGLLGMDSHRLGVL